MGPPSVHCTIIAEYTDEAEDASKHHCTPSCSVSALGKGTPAQGDVIHTSPEACHSGLSATTKAMSQASVSCATPHCKSLKNLMSSTVYSHLGWGQPDTAVKPECWDSAPFVG
uniref:Uncharacterized protein n=1 Tax=Eutreptiella gymnastica TaxID=73025 RepID=A0A7S1IK77_9EUGL|mmetsp:Transcript_23089/g.41582  ORF Transcript_23089/g.41582 Transcript_23089/m.41582 type:complete len:113 (+) Transcript_23089:195-533(+)